PSLFLASITAPPPPPPLFPYTTLFRSPGADLPFQNEGSLQCWMVALIIGALVLVLAILMAYQRYVAGKKPVQHLCDYCGHMVIADRKSTRLNSSHEWISYAVFCLKKKN